jgi:uncharacterized membrane protein YeaQ/YmgE (transglycosylase-associated protein family)
MTIIDFLTFLVIVAICASVAQAVFNFQKGGVLVSVVLGTLGAFIGIMISRALELPELFTIQVGPETIPIIWSIMGSGFFAIVLSLFLKRI